MIGLVEGFVTGWILDGAFGSFISLRVVFGLVVYLDLIFLLMVFGIGFCWCGHTFY
jgi:hypothetical protein